MSTYIRKYCSIPELAERSGRSVHEVRQLLITHGLYFKRVKSHSLPGNKPNTEWRPTPKANNKGLARRGRIQGRPNTWIWYWPYLRTFLEKPK